MGRLLSTAALAAAIVAGPAIAARPAMAGGAWARPADGTDSGAAVSTTELPVPIGPRRSTAALCQDTAKIVVLGLQMFVGQMDRVSAQARAGDLVGADLAVKDAGAGLAVVAGQLRRDAVDAEDPSLRTTINDMAAEFERLGTTLPGLTALPAFDAGALDAMATKMGVLCGPTPKPTAPVLPTQTARGVPAPSPAGG
jgi:hypothetical protein